MTTALDSAALRSLLDQPDPHVIAAAAHEARVDRFGLRTSIAAVAHVDPSGCRSHCPVTGELAPTAGFARGLAELPDSISDLILLAAGNPSAQDFAGLLDLLPGVPPRDAGFAATVQLDAADVWMNLDLDLRELADRGVRVISEGVAPRLHPAFGDAERCAGFWRDVATAGMRGHAVVLYGPGLGLDSVFEQLSFIASVQRETSVFLSIAPCIFNSDAPMSSEDHLLTQASLDLRVLAACRLYETGVDHVSVRYERGDLKSAHMALACGADDLVGHLYLQARDKKADVEAKDLSLQEAQRWIAEAGFQPRLRNGLFEFTSFEEVEA